MARWYLGLAILGMFAQVIGWIQLLRRVPLSNEISLQPLLLTTTVLGMSVCREAIRLTSLGRTRLEELIPQQGCSK